MVQMAVIRPYIQIDDMLASLVYQCRDGLAGEVVKTTARERKALCLKVLYRRGEVDPTVEPGLDRVLVGGHHVHQMAWLQRSDVVRNHCVRESGGRRQQEYQRQAGCQREAATEGYDWS